MTTLTLSIDDKETRLRPHRRLRIAQIAPLFLPVPPLRYGGTERVVHALTEALVERGHDVTLFAAGGSTTSARLVECSPAPVWELGANQRLAYDVLQAEMICNYSVFDIIHSHVEYIPWLAAPRLRAPLITTLHGRLDLPELRPMMRAFGDQALVSISNAQRAPLQDLDLNWIATILHGLNLGRTYRLGDGEGGYLAFVGRIAPEKGVPTAIRIALRTGTPLKIAARVDPQDEEHFRTEVLPHLDNPLIEWLGEIDDPGKAELLAGARALLLPIDWEEPFGLSFIEAMAAGTPVIGRPRGSLPEIIHHGLHGFLLEDEDDMVAAVRFIDQLDRQACRQWALSQFSPQRMARDYERAYERVLESTVNPAGLSWAALS